MKGLFNAEGRIFLTLNHSPDTGELDPEYVSAMIASYGAAGVVDFQGSPSRQYVVNKEARPREVNPAKLEGTKLKNLPAPCQITLNDEIFECKSTEAELVLEAGKRYFLTVRKWPFLDLEVEIEN